MFQIQMKYVDRRNRRVVWISGYFPVTLEETIIYADYERAQEALARLKTAWIFYFSDVQRREGYYDPYVVDFRIVEKLSYYPESGYRKSEEQKAAASPPPGPVDDDKKENKKQKTTASPSHKTEYYVIQMLYVDDGTEEWISAYDPMTMERTGDFSSEELAKVSMTDLKSRWKHYFTQMAGKGIDTKPYVTDFRVVKK